MTAIKECYVLLRAGNKNQAKCKVKVHNVIERGQYNFCLVHFKKQWYYVEASCGLAGSKYYSTKKEALADPEVLTRAFEALGRRPKDYLDPARKLLAEAKEIDENGKDLWWDTENNWEKIR